MAWDEDISKSTPNSFEMGNAGGVVSDESIQTPKWLVIIFKTVGVLSYVIAAIAALLLVFAQSIFLDLPWHFWLMLFSGIGLFVLVGCGLYKIAKWAGAFIVLSALLGVGGSIYAILAQGKAPDFSFLVSLIPTIVYVALSWLFLANRRYFSGEYFHPLYSSAALVLIAVLAVTSWSSSKSVLDFLNQQSTTNLSAYEVDAMVRAFNYPLTIENKFSINFPGEPQHTTRSVSIPNTTSSIVENKYTSRDDANKKEYTLTVLEYPPSETLDQDRLETIANNNIGRLPSAYVGDNQALLTPIDDQGKTGLEFAVANQTMDVWIMGRYVIDGQTLYEIRVIYTEGTYHPNDLGAFLDSFKIGGVLTYSNERYGFAFEYPSEANWFSISSNMPWYGQLSWGAGVLINMRTLLIGQFPKTNTIDCKEYSIRKEIVDGRQIEIIEAVDCVSGDVGPLRASKLVAIIPVTSRYELIVDISEYGGSLSDANKQRILSLIQTFTFKR